MTHIFKEVESCDFCDHEPAPGSGVVALDLIVERIIEGFLTENERPDEGPPDWLIRGFLEDTEQLLADNDVSENDEVNATINDSILTTEWLPVSRFYAGDPGEMIKSTWDKFRNYTKHSRRYTFMLPESIKRTPLMDCLPMEETLPAVASAIVDSGKLIELDPGDKWWRVRVNAPGFPPLPVNHLGPPPALLASDNRMTPKGITAFYGASTDTGAIAEVTGYTAATDTGVLAQWTSERPMFVADLRDKPKIPSLFDRDRRHLRDSTRFLSNFIDDIRKVAKPDEKQDLENIPTQIIAEYLQQDLEITGHVPIAGVLWRSTKDKEVTCCVLFISPDEVARPEEATTKTVLTLEAASERFLGAPLTGWLAS